MTILEELYNGNIHPTEKHIKKGSTYQKINDQLAENLDKLMILLKDEEKCLFEKIEGDALQLGYISEKENFIDGSCLGAQMMLEIMSRKSEDFI